MSFVSGQERDPFQTVIIQQMLQQRPEGLVLVRIDAVKLFPVVADCNNRALRPPGQLFMQFIPEAFDLIGIRRTLIIYMVEY